MIKHLQHSSYGNHYHHHHHHRHHHHRERIIIRSRHPNWRPQSTTLSDVSDVT